MGLDSYLALYRLVGAPWQRDQRLRLPRADVERLLEDQSNHIHVLRLRGEAIGFCEFLGVGNPEVELVHFGLVAKTQGRGLVASSSTTCYATADHFHRCAFTCTPTPMIPRAFYEKAGFRRYMSRMESFPD